MSLCESPLTLIEEAAHGSCRSTNSLWGGVCVSPSVFLCVCMCEGETCWAVNQSEPVLGHSSQCCVGVFSVTGSHNSAFSRWFPAGLRMTCDNITVLKGQAWREPVGGLGHSQTVQTSNTVLCTHTVMQSMGLTFLKEKVFYVLSNTQYWTYCLQGNANIYCITWTLVASVAVAGRVQKYLHADKTLHCAFTVDYIQL